MANNNDDQNEILNDSETEISGELDTDTPNNSNSHVTNYLISGLTFIIAITAIFIAVYTMQLHKHLNQIMLAGDGNLAGQLEQIKQTQSKTQAQVETKTGNINQNQNELQHKIDSLQKQLAAALNQRLYQNQDWLLLKARYYLELSQINSTWSDDYKTSIALLHNADDLLKQLNEPQILNIRKAIATEMSNINGTPVVDVAGLLSTLDAMQMSVSKLTIQSALTNNLKKTESSETEATDSPTWRARIQDSVHLLEKLVVIRRDNEEIKPILSPLYESLLKESIRLNLQEAQWAILNNNSAVYQLALSQVGQNLNRSFDASNQNTIALLNQLNELHDIKLTQDKPTVGLALPLLNQLIESKELMVKKSNHVEKE